MRIPTAAECTASLLEQGLLVHDEPGRLNTLILRRRDGTLDAFDDMLVVWGRDRTLHPVFMAGRCTTDPGRPSREHPRRRDGTAVWAVGQVVDGMQIGIHHPGTPGAYPCLVPVTSMPVLRFTGVGAVGSPSTSTTLQIHHANAHRESTVVGAWSEGCVVVANPVDWLHFMALWQAQVLAGWSRFTVSCIAV